MFVSLLRELNETKKNIVKSRKSRVKIFNTIKDALGSGTSYGTIFSTKGANRLYVVTKPTWGKKSKAGGATKVAKGFTPGKSTPGSSWSSIKSHAVRTMKKHGGKKGFKKKQLKGHK